jgi:hypothetical protein
LDEHLRPTAYVLTSTQITNFLVENFVRPDSLRRFCKAILPSGIILDNVAIHFGETRAWALLSSKPMLDRDGNALRGSDQKAKYRPFVSSAMKEQRDRFYGSEEAFPDALKSL